MSIQRITVEERKIDVPGHWPAYPVDESLLLSLPNWTLDGAGVPRQVEPAGYDPTMITLYALRCWNRFLATGEIFHRETFVAQARWLIEHELLIGNDAGGWPIPFPRADTHAQGPWLSALTQGSGISVLIRAYQLTREEIFLDAVHRVLRTFKRDILEGGVQSPIGEEGNFFEEVAIYPATHMLSGFIIALLGLYEYIALIGDGEVEQLVNRAHVTMHSLLDEFDTGFWTYPDLGHRQLASVSQQALQAMLLSTLARYTHCDHCLQASSRWQSYRSRLDARLRFLLASHSSSLIGRLRKHLQSLLFPPAAHSRAIRVCIPVTAFPITGGIRAVLASVMQVTKGCWQVEYVTQHPGPNPEGLTIHAFGTRQMTAWQFPAIWLYFLAGWRKLVSLLQSGADYQVFLPQDGIATAAFTGLAAKLAGRRVVCIDHGNLTLLKNAAFRSERLQALETKNWSRPRLLFARLRYRCYWPSLSLLAYISARFVDHFLVPGVAGDGVEEVCKSLGIRPSQITRFASMVDINHYNVRDAAEKASLREKYTLAADALVVTMACRLSPEKGIDIALEAIRAALTGIPLEQRVRVLIAGDGPLRRQVEEKIDACGLGQTISLLGETPAKDVVSLLSISNIFLYTSIRGACFSMAILEAMASGCAVIASTLPMANEKLLSEGRGIAIPAGDARQAAQALVRLLRDGELCQQMGQRAREYVETYHSPAVFGRTLSRTTYWSGLDSFLHCN